MNDRIIVADSSPLIAFARINQIQLLSHLFNTILIPQTVAAECLEDISRAGAQDIQKMINKKLITIHPDIDTEIHKNLFDILDQGEIYAIALALKLSASLLIDEKLGRNIAKNLNLKTIGTAGVLLLAKQRKLISKVKPLIEDLKSAGCYLSDALIKEVLKNAKE